MKQVTLNGKVALVTGANSGIGRVTARELALQGYHVFLACRSEDKTQDVLAEIARISQGTAQAEYLPLDLANLASVQKCAELFLARKLPLHLLVCNAGLSGQKGMTKSGFEITFGVCHVGHFLLTNLLLDNLKASAPARVVVVASKMHRWTKALDLGWVQQPTRTPGALKEYSQTKLANILFVKELAQRLAGTGVTAYALHPGVVASDIWRAVPWPFDRAIKRFMLTVDEGARTSLYCATSADVANQSGLYYDDCQVVASSPASEDAQAAKRLWEESERWVAS
jgi:dehydrogenase/reductase SDR family protein 13